MGEVAAACIGGEAHIGQPQGGVLREVAAQTVHELPQGPLGLRRDGEHVPRTLDTSGPFLDDGRFLQDDVGVGAAEAERADSRDPPSTVGRPRRPDRRHHDRHRFPIDVGRGILEVQVGRDLLVLEGQNGLDEAHHARRRLQVAQVGLHRADLQGPVRVPPQPQHRCQGPHLDGISEPGAGAVRLHVVDLGGPHAASRQRLPEKGLLGEAVGDGEATAGSILVHGAAAHEGEHAVALGQSVGEPLQDHHPAPFAADDPVRGGIEGLAPPVASQHAGLRRGDRPVGSEDRVHASGQGHARLAAAQALAGQVNRHQRGRARRVHRHAGTLQPQDIGDPSGHEIQAGAGEDVVVEVFEIGLPQAPRVIAGRDAHEDARPAPRQPERRLARVLQRLPRHLEDEAVLRVHAHRVAGSDAEEPRVEPVHMLEEAAPACGHPSGRVWVGVVVGVNVPAVRRDFAHRVDTVPEQPPEGFRVVGPRDAAAQSDDGDGLGPLPLHRVQLGLQVHGQQGEPLGRELGDAVEEVAHAPPPAPARRASSRSTSSSASCSILSSTSVASPESSTSVIAREVGGSRSKTSAAR